MVTLNTIKHRLKRLWFSPFFFNIRLFFAGLEAELRHEATGKRYYVLLMNGKMVVRNNIDSKIDRKIGRMRKSVDYIGISKACLYKTKHW